MFFTHFRWNYLRMLWAVIDLSDFCNINDSSSFFVKFLKCLVNVGLSSIIWFSSECNEKLSEVDHSIVVFLKEIENHILILLWKVDTTFSHSKEEVVFVDFVFSVIGRKLSEYSSGWSNWLNSSFVDYIFCLVYNYEKCYIMKVPSRTFGKSIMVIFILFISMILYILLININLNTEDDFDMHKKKCQNQNKLQRWWSLLSMSLTIRKEVWKRTK